MLAAFTDQKDNLLAMKKFFSPQSADFPINAYMTVISDYMIRSYYTETEQKYVTSEVNSPISTGATHQFGACFQVPFERFAAKKKSLEIVDFKGLWRRRKTFEPIT